MKKVITLLLLAVTFSFVGCAKTVTAPVPGQLNTFDAYAFRVLADTQAALNAFSADVTSGKVTETPAIKSGLNTAINDYNIAEATYQAWRAAGATGSTVALAKQVATVQSDFTTLTQSAASTISTPTPTPAVTK
jgi:hypothetical protein